MTITYTILYLNLYSCTTFKYYCSSKPFKTDSSFFYFSFYVVSVFGNFTWFYLEACKPLVIYVNDYFLAD